MDGGSMWSSLIELLCNLPYPEDSCQKLVNTLKVYYANAESTLRILDEFEQSYKPDKAIWWYTRPIFLCGILNKGMRQHNIELIFLFGFFIQDLYRQLKQEHEKYSESSTKVYRGQIMDQIEYLDFDIYNTQNVNSFFSSSFDRQVALAFLPERNQISPGTYRVLFEIEFKSRPRTRPYANISHLSFFPEENEILFMPGIGFCGDMDEEDSLNDKNEDVSMIKLYLDDDWVMKDENHYQGSNKKRVLKNTISMYTGNFRSASNENINLIYDQLIKLYPAEKQWILACKFDCLALKNSGDAEENYEQSLTNWYKCLDNNDELNCHINIGELHHQMGIHYQLRRSDYFSNELLREYHFDLAKEYYDLAIRSFQSVLEKRDLTDCEQFNVIDHLCDIYRLKVRISEEENNQSDLTQNLLLALKYREKEVEGLKKLYSYDEASIASSLKDLGDLYYKMSDYDKAIIHYDDALETSLRLPDEFLNLGDDIISVSEKLIDICIHQKNNNDLAFFYELIKHEQILKDNEIGPYTTDSAQDTRRTKIISSHIELADIYIRLCEYHSASKHLREAIDLYEDMTTSTYKDQVNISMMEDKMRTVQTILATSNVPSDNILG
ncbi:unnamed protein product [Rotaria socialis]|uniref:Uncharacterized protein n=1 Tax=Rotaria socialis TaxID=392032 RepID=A0A818XI49_9BILA|nr:unnamed protein product [Rotaria socialis]CAF4587245.1 unnamed protein product [Rotaria socialis]